MKLRRYDPLPCSRPRGLVDEEHEMRVEETAFVEFHCWNVGTPGGVEVPEVFWVFMGFPETHRVMWRIVEKCIKPALEAARRAGIQVIHVQPESIASKYPENRVSRVEDSDPPLEAIPGYNVMRAEMTHGKGYMRWEGWSRLDICEPLKPLPGEPVIVTTEEMDLFCREQGIINLIYAGFATNLCILDSDAAMKPMRRLGYRCILLRECTLAVEHHDTLDEMLNTRTAIRYIETWVGYTASLQDFLSGLGQE